MFITLGICGALMVVFLAGYGLKLALGVEKQQRRQESGEGHDPHH
jgi:hypothetical protein